MSLYKKSLGKQGENIAVDYLLDRDFHLIDRNFHSKFGEIDIIAQKNKKLFFVEVKTRGNLHKGKPHESITLRKIHQMKKAATFYLINHEFKNFKYAIAVISIVLEDVHNPNLKFYESIE